MPNNQQDQVERIRNALNADDASVRLKAVIFAGTHPQVELLSALIDRCAVEPDFTVREQLTWALVRFPNDLTLPLLMTEVHSQNNQARSQALHTLSKIGAPSAWPVITPSLICDPVDEVAQAAWRAAVCIVPKGEQKWLARQLAGQFGRGNREVKLSLSSALVDLGEIVTGPIIEEGLKSDDSQIRAHAIATKKLFSDPQNRSDFGSDQVKVLLAPRPHD